MYIPIFKLLSIGAIFLTGIVGGALTAALAGRGELITCAVFDSLAAGTFLYIAVVDIIGDEFMRPGDRMPKSTLLTFGLAFMAVLAIWV